MRIESDRTMEHTEQTPLDGAQKRGIKVCHVTSAHTSDDTRILHKECRSLAEAGYDVLLVAPGASRVDGNVTVVGCGEKPVGRFQRIFRYARKVCKTAQRLDADVYHLHDPELLAHIGLFLSGKKKVIFDSHEDYSFEKMYLPKPVRKAVKLGYLLFERDIAKRVDGVVCCYQATMDRMKPYCRNIEFVYNFPIITEDMRHPRTVADAAHDVFALGYAGGVDSTWSHETVVAALAGMENVSYVLAGNADPAFIEKLKAMPGGEHVRFLGKIPFARVRGDIYEKADVGIALSAYIEQCGTYGNLANTKLFEIMKEGLPVIATDFVLWKGVVEEGDCGVCVCPSDVDAVRSAINRMREHPEERRRMGENARRLIYEKYNWQSDCKKLFKLYDAVCRGMGTNGGSAL